MDELIPETIWGLTETAFEKKRVLGTKAQSEIMNIRNVIVDLVHFWDLEERYIKDFDNDLSK